MKYIVKWIAWIWVVIGGLNWGLVGFFNFDLVAAIFSSTADLIYDLVGLSALVLIFYKIFKYKKKK